MFGARCQPNRTGHLATRRCAASSSMKARSCRRSRFLATARKRISIRTVLGSCRVFRTRRAEPLIITIQSFLIRRDGLTVLVDACGGNDKERARPHFHRRSWPWLETLRYAGVAPKDIDVVLSAICPAVWPTGVSNFAQIPLGRCAYNSSSPKPEGRPNENPPHVQA